MNRKTQDLLCSSANCVNGQHMRDRVRQKNQNLLDYVRHCFPTAMRSHKVLAIALSLCALLALSSAISLPPGTVTLQTSGYVAAIASLQVSGRYIVDSIGRTVVLSGANMPRFIDTPYGDWILPNGQVVWATWDISAAGSNLDAMRSWGMNVVRTLSTIEWWVKNAGNHRQIIKDWISMAGNRGMYVVYGFWRVNGTSGYSPLPYPPYCGGNDIIRNETDFVNCWHSVADELKDYPNAIFELWNEPTGNPEAEASWFEVVQQTIDAIRSTGSQNIIVVQWGYCLGVNLEYPPPSNPYGGLDWIERHPLDDSRNNILYSTHIYRNSLLKTSTPTYTFAYTYEDLTLAYNLTKVNYVLDTLNMSLWIGEVGPNQWEADLESEYAFYNNTLRIMNELHVGYAAWWWWPTGTAWGHFESGEPNYKPNRAGQILQYRLVGAGP